MEAFTEFTLIICLAAFLGALFNKFKQPPILGYIACGLLVGFFLPEFRKDLDKLEVLSKIGIAFLLFVLGLNLNLKEIKRVGKVALSTGLVQILFTFIFGWIISVALGFNFVSAFYIAVGLTFSSTIIIIKLLSQKNQLETLPGRISVAFLLVQDFVAIIILVVLSASRTITTPDIQTIFITLGSVAIKGALTTVLIFLFVRFIFDKILDSVRKEKEVLFVTVIAWVLAISALMGSSLIGFSMEIGALIAGITLAHRFESLQIESWTKPLRDFFIIIFFVILGLQVNFDSVGSIIIIALILSLFVLVVKPLIVLIVMCLLKYSLKTSFYTSLVVGQVSEFSLIVIKFAYDLGHVNNSVLTLVTIVGGITMTISSLMIFYNDKLYEISKKYLKVFEFNNKKFADDSMEETLLKEYDVLLLGCHRMGKRLLSQITDGRNVLIVDIDPRVVKTLKDEKFDVVYGDISDATMYESYKLNLVKVLISTVPSVKENLKLLEYIKTLDKKPIAVIRATEDYQVKEYYKAGADIVVYPQHLGSEFIKTIVTEGLVSDHVQGMKERHLKDFLEEVIVKSDGVKKGIILQLD